ncbi:prepilin peptidase [Pseudidiomarina insulisalsae]|uniref:Prepilin leader peptidase/N-methyltransferase n=1 Tax=Pseudidiomarina insulisalsae TaxID=575789 RepID=A0A432YNH0_9GAMM|nr:A24 family peptidase [Pseudidiomarina insulisalsae]RUO62494.1 prepilin peptidase [Pseudidiomarina insulisalsae]
MLEQFPDLYAIYPAYSGLTSSLGLVLGLVVGSFLNVVIGRLPVMLQRQWERDCAAVTGQPEPKRANFNISTPGSHCPKCRHAIKWYDNIPVISWLLLKGKCRHCNARISLRYPAIEMLTAVFFAAIVWYQGFSWPALYYMVFAGLLIAMFFIDYDHMLLPDQLTYFTLWLGLFVAWAGGPVSLADAVIGAIAGYLFLWSVYWAYKLLTGKEGMGYGDFKLLAAFGAWAGYQMLPVIVLASAFSGAVIGITLQLAAKKGQGQPIPFGPFLICGGVIAMIWGEQLLQWYWGLVRV